MAAPHSVIALRRLSSATRNNDDLDCSVHAMVLSFHDLRGLPLRRGKATHDVAITTEQSACLLPYQGHDTILEDEKAGFTSPRRIAEYMFNLRILAENYLEH